MKYQPKKRGLRERLYSRLASRFREPWGTAPKWCQAIWCTLHPIKALVLRVNESQGYQFRTDEWIISSDRYHGGLFRELRFYEGKPIKITFDENNRAKVALI